MAKKNESMKIPEESLAELRFPKWATWTQSDPPEDQRERQRQNKRLPTGVWGRYLVWCANHPNEWFRSHPLLHKHSAQQAVSEIKYWRIIQGQRDILTVGPQGLNETPISEVDGVWEVAWGHAEDENGLEQWYVWTKWVPHTKVARAKPKAQTTSKPRKPRRKVVESE